MDDQSLYITAKNEEKDDHPQQDIKETLYECKECHLKFKREASLAAHFDAAHAEKVPPSYSCPECEYKTPHLGHLKFHITKHHSNPDELIEKAIKSRYFYCPHCSKKFNHINCLHEHVALDHENRKPYACDICGNEIKTLKLYKQHMSRHEKNASKYQCNFCDASFPQQNMLFKHIRENHPKHHVCNVCGANFTRKENLTQHMKKHEQSVNERKTIVCPIEGCKATFTRESNLKTHLKSIHGGVLPYACEVCGKEFLYPSLLSLHMESHEQKPEEEIIDLDESILDQPFD